MVRFQNTSHISARLRKHDQKYDDLERGGGHDLDFQNVFLVGAGDSENLSKN